MNSASALKEMNNAYKFNKLLARNIKDPTEFMRKIRESKEKYERQLKVLDETNTNTVNINTKSNEVLNEVHNSVKFELYGDYINEVDYNISSSVKRKWKPWTVFGGLASGGGLYAMCSYFIDSNLFTWPIKIQIAVGTVATILSFNLIFDSNGQNKILKALKKEGFIVEGIEE